MAIRTLALYGTLVRMVELVLWQHIKLRFNIAIAIDIVIVIAIVCIRWLLALTNRMHN